MGNLADDTGSDIEIFRRWDTGTVYADSRTEAPERLLELLDTVGFERHSPIPIYTWHQLPEGLDEHETTRRATRAWVLLAAAGYTVNLDPALHCERTERVVRAGLNADARRAATSAARAPAPQAQAPRERQHTH